MALTEADQQQRWAEAQRRCWLSDQAVRMAKERSRRPRRLITTSSSPTPQGTAPVADGARAIDE